LIIRRPSIEELNELREIAWFQFGVRGEDFIPDNVLLVISPNTGKPRYIILNGEKYLSIRARDFRFNLHISSGMVLNKILPHPKFRVYVKNEYAELVAQGNTLFSKHVLMCDPDVRPGDEVLIVDPHGALLAVGRAKLSGIEMVYYNRGEAVKVREGVYRWLRRSSSSLSQTLQRTSSQDHSS
jgi:uncharacterized protein with predicted RNA binding PUA domain